MNVKFPDYKFSRLVFSDFHLSYQPVYPGVKDSPLQKSIDETDVLELAYDENTFSFEVSTINYDSPGNALYSWKLEGFYEKWTQPGANNLIRFTNLPPGRYILHVRAISREEHDIVFQERAMKIIITQPFWSSWWAILCYILLVIGGFYFVLRVINLRKQKNISDEKTQFFINTAHDIRTPLNVVVGFAELLTESKELTAEAKVEYGKMIQENAENLLEYVNSILELSRLESGKTQYVQEECEVMALCRQEIAIAEHTDNGRVSIRLKTDIESMAISIDKNRFSSLLSSLLIPSENDENTYNITIRIRHDKEKNMLFFKVTGTPLAKARFENKTALIRHEINAHFIHAFNGTYKVQEGASEGPLVLFSIRISNQVLTE